ncbi:hypothetical protein ANCDUO_17911, partial [Ancylostoma duodenale]
CDPKKCGEGELQNPQTGECTSIDCPLGYYPSNGMCHGEKEIGLERKDKILSSYCDRNLFIRLKTY